MKKYHIQPGDKFGRLTAINLSHIGNHNRSYFIFKCDCGKEKTILGAGVKSGNTKSCGCLSVEVKKAKRLPGNHGTITAIWLGYKRHAKDRGFSFLISREFFTNIIQKDCYYCGSKPNNLKKTKNDKNGLLYNGVDRVNSKNDYTKKNCVPCCKNCNLAKRDMTTMEFLTWVKSVYNYQTAMANQWG